MMAMPPPSPSELPGEAHCSLHGAYPLWMRDDKGDLRWFPPECPQCLRQVRLRQRLGEGGIPRRFSDCRFDNYRTRNPQQAHVLAVCRAYAEGFGARHALGQCLVLCGRPGTGKNHLAAAIAGAVVNLGYSLLQFKAGRYLEDYWGQGFEGRGAWLADLAQVDLLILDEVGRHTRGTGARDALFALLDARYEAQRPTLLLTNLNREGLIEVLGAAAYDRLTEGGGLRLTLDWESCRRWAGRPRHHDEEDT